MQEGHSQFDVTVGRSFGAECYELEPIPSSTDSQALDIDIGFYRDVGLGVTVQKTENQVDQIKKEICKIFSSNIPKVTTEANIKVVDFLDITMDLATKQDQPFMKPNNPPPCEHKHSNPPPAIDQEKHTQVRKHPSIKYIVLCRCVQENNSSLSDRI